MGMNETHQRALLRAETLDITLCQVCFQQFDGGQAIEIYLLAELHIRETPTSQQPFETIITQLLTHAVAH